MAPFNNLRLCFLAMIIEKKQTPIPSQNPRLKSELDKRSPELLEPFELVELLLDFISLP